MTSDRLIPLASVRVFDPGAGDGALLSPAFIWQDVLEETGKDGTYDAISGESNLELLPEAGLVCRPFGVAQDTRLGDYACSGGAWGEWRPDEHYRLVQWDATANVTRSAASRFKLPPDPSVLFSLQCADTPPDQTQETNPPFAAVSVGNGAFLIQHHGRQGLRLLRWNAATGGYDDAGSIPVAEGAARQGETWILFRCHAGNVMASADWGHSYVTAANADGSPIAVAEAPAVYITSGLQAMFGMHQVLYRNGQYTSPKRRTYELRAAATATLTYRGDDLGHPPGELDSLITLADLIPEGGSSEAQYNATLVPESRLQDGAPWEFWRSPLLQAVRMSWAATADAADPEAYTTPWDDLIESIQVEKPERLDESSATIVVVLSDATSFFTVGWRYRKVQILLGHQLSDDSDDLWVRFTGYISSIRVVQEAWNEVRVAIACENATCPARHQEWDYEAPFGGQTPNQAIAAVLATIHPAISYTGCADGDGNALPLGPVKAGAYKGDLGQPKWDLIERIARHAGMEMAVHDTGELLSLALNYVAPTVVQTWQADPSDELEMLRSLAYELDVRENATGIIAIGSDSAGRDIRSHIIGGEWKDPDAVDYAPWPLPHVLRSTDVQTPEGLSRLVHSEWPERIPLRYTSEVQSPVLTSLARRDKVQVVGSIAGTDDAAIYCVRTLRHEYRADPTGASLETRATLRKL